MKTNAAAASDVSRRYISPHVPAAAARLARRQPDRCPGSGASPGVSDGALMVDLYKGRWVDRGMPARIRESLDVVQDMAVVLVLVIRVQYPRSRTHNVEDVMFIAGCGLMRVVRICPACILGQREDHRPTTRKRTPISPLFPAETRKERRATEDGAECARTGEDIYGLLDAGGGQDHGCGGEMRAHVGIERAMPLEGDLDNKASGSARSASLRR